MNKNTKILICGVGFLCLLVILIWQNLHSGSVQPFKALISGGPTTLPNMPCIIEITADGRLKATTGSINLELTDETYNVETYFKDDRRTRSKSLTKTQKTKINELIEAIKKEGTSTEQRTYVADGGFVFYVLIDGVKYNCIYDDPMGNWEVNELAEILVEISPINVFKHP